MSAGRNLLFFQVFFLVEKSFFEFGIFFGAAYLFAPFAIIFRAGEKLVDKRARNPQTLAALFAAVRPSTFHKVIWAAFVRRAAGALHLLRGKNSVAPA